MTNGSPVGQSLPPLSPEDHVCHACDFDYAAIDVPAALVSQLESLATLETEAATGEAR